MADYNVNMKQWNGSSFDNVLPLAFNSKALDGKSYDDIIRYAQSKNLLLYTGQYTGTGTYGGSNPTTLTFPFEPLLIMGMIQEEYNTSNYLFSRVTNMALAKTAYNQARWFSTNTEQYLSVSNDRKTVKFYSAYDAYYQYNSAGVVYHYAAIGGYDIGGGN